MRLIFALVIATACGSKKESAPAPAPEPEPEPEPASASAPAPTPAPEGAPDCEPVVAALDVGAICGEAFPLVATRRGMECSLAPAANAPRNRLVRVEVNRATTLRLPGQYPAAGWSEVRESLTLGRRGRFPWLIKVRSRGESEPLCDAAEMNALTARVAELLPADPDAVERPPTPQCEQILTAARVNKVCGTKLGPLAVDTNEDGDTLFCSRGAGGFGFQVGTELRGGGITQTIGKGPYALSLSATGRSGCEPEDLKKLLAESAPRAARALARAKK